jgi:hypothetical protein
LDVVQPGKALSEMLTLSPADGDIRQQNRRASVHAE